MIVVCLAQGQTINKYIIINDDVIMSPLQCLSRATLYMYNNECMKRELFVIMLGFVL